MRCDGVRDQVLDYLVLGSSLSVRNFAHLGSSLSVCGFSRFGAGHAERSRTQVVFSW